MKIKNIENVNDFFKVVDKCEGKVENEKARNPISFS